MGKEEGGWMPANTQQTKDRMIRQHTEVTMDNTLGKFYMGHSALGAQSSLKQFDDFEGVVRSVQREVSTTKTKRYIVQVVAVLEPEPPPVRPTRLTILEGFNPTRRG